MKRIRLPRMTGSAAGFTLVELMVVLAVVGLLAATAAPSFQGAVTSRRLESGTIQIVNAIRLARAEAIKRSAVVAVRPLSGTDWSSGLIVHLEADANPANALTADDTVIRQFQMPARSTFHSASPSALAFDAQGRNVAPTLDGTPQDGFLQIWVNGTSKTVTISRTGATSIVTVY
jgi:type IV fimbrial biogenesis protein FimT